jgi:hypothetical protein
MSGTKALKKLLRRFGLELSKLQASDDTDLYVRLYGSEAVKNRKFYNIAAGAYKGFGGGFRHPCWTNVDVNRSWKHDKDFPGAVEHSPDCDIAHDLLDCTPLPIASDSAELIHSRFTVDRITDEAAQLLFNEAHRILKPGGIIRLVSTNLDLDYRAYLNNDRDYYFWLDPNVTMEQAFLFHMVTQVSTLYEDPFSQKVTDEEFKNLLKEMSYEDAVSRCCAKCSVEIHKRHRYDHFNWWNRNKYERMLGIAGFKVVYVSAPEQSAAPVMRNGQFFDNEHNRVMMYVEASKG